MSVPHHIDFVRWRSDSASGGDRYDDELTAGLGALGVDVREHIVSGAWPCPTADDRQRLAEVTTRGDWLIDNIIGSAVPEALAARIAAGRRVTLLMHYFPADDPSLTASERKRLAADEAAAVGMATNVVVNSEWAAAEMASRYGRHDAVVALPGVQVSDAAPGTVRRGGVPALLWLGRITRPKDPLTFVDALVRIKDLDWTAQLVGPGTLDAELDHDLHGRITSAGLGDRVTLPGQQDGGDLAAVWEGSDLLVHTSRHETYGMVVSEALARGIPAMVATDTGAVEAARGVGSTFPQGDVAALAGLLREWLTNKVLRERWRAEAMGCRAHMPTWADAAGIVADVLRR